ncbi:Asp23/Gls24 family envelope stress response protein [Paenibacillus sp. ACRSA]|uniref:Asp23/Gls24 family envelope stress response protein n=1 Tax=Paenibacillus sp. ACRSA TaxID=2918211 RepID=UPI001EF6AFF4|nr:Asp23/Gls24 family envelope stress response protein [Paenibacillus sp. ACRSA]MCG7380034.1 Asp23/Gls24 family envelope stress response protein [Paenibacillus sp. ACRSA]
MIQTDIGKINVLEQAITTIVSGVARLESGIILLSTGAVDSLIKHVSGKKMHKGVSVTFSNSKLIIELRIVVTYGVKIHYVSRELQSSIFESVNHMTGISPDQIHIRIEGIKQ